MDVATFWQSPRNAHPRAEPRFALRSPELARRGVCTALSLAVVGGLGPASAADLVPSAALGLDEIRAGAAATTKTVLSGTDIVEIPVEIISVVRNIGPQRDMILARGLGEEIERLGVPSGMSGSPVYVDGRLIGAVSSTWSFAREPLMGITPVHQMAREAAWGSQGVSTGGEDLLRATIPEVPGSSAPGPIRTPLVLSGFDRRLVNLAAEIFEPWGFTVAEGGTAGDDQAGGAIEPGATIGVRLAGGDANITSFGTVTWVDGDFVHGWGHPMFQMGEVEMPLVSAYIHTVIPNQFMSFKLGSGGDVVGTLTADHRSGIFGRLGDAPRTTSFDLNVVRGETSESFHFDLVRDEFLAPSLVGITAMNALLAHGGAVGEETVRFSQRLVLDDAREATVETFIAGNRTLRQITTLLSEATTAIIGNPFEDVRIDRIDGEISVDRGIRLAALTELSLEDDRPEPGEILRGTYTLHDWRGGESRHPFEVQLPADARTGRYLLLVADAATAELYEAERDPRSFGPRSLDELLARIDRLRQTDEVHIHLYRQSRGVLIHGRPLADLPPSALSVMRGTSRSGVDDNLPAELVHEHRAHVDRLVQGAHTILFEVEKERR
jgi:hypothetical protein